MSDQPTRDLATRAFQNRALDEFAALRSEQAAMLQDIVEVRSQQMSTSGLTPSSNGSLRSNNGCVCWSLRLFQTLKLINVFELLMNCGNHDPMKLFPG
jgi:hypothetical protein